MESIVGIDRVQSIDYQNWWFILSFALFRTLVWFNFGPDNSCIDMDCAGIVERFQPISTQFHASP